MKNIFISPHFDDAIGSCGGLIQSLDNVLICTIFTKQYKGELSQVAKDLHNDWNLKNAVKSRKKENKNACKFLKLKSTNLNFLEFIYRKNSTGFICKSFESLFGNENIYEKELEIELIKKIKNKFSINNQFYFPMSMGGHVDHVLLHNVGLVLNSEGYKVKFYQDFSYQINDSIKNYKVEKFYFDEMVLNKKITACMCYVSQMPDLFGNNDNAKKYFKKFKEKEKYYERYYERISTDNGDY